MNHVPRKVVSRAALAARDRDAVGIEIVLAEALDTANE
jgi:hypothetical protein